jgi:polyphenol oxidase
MLASVVTHACMTFPALSALGGFAHAFTLRHPEIDVRVDRDEAIRRLTGWHLEILEAGLGFASDRLMTVQQVHGDRVVVVRAAERAAAPGADGLICGDRGMALGIHVADCCAVFLADPVTGAFGVVHSGRKGTEQNITGKAIRALGDNFGTRPENLVVQLSPCIRPPAYEVDFAAAIRSQARDAGVPPERVHDEGICTSADSSRFYSYRREKGRTGRMLALLGRK